MTMRKKSNCGRSNAIIDRITSIGYIGYIGAKYYVNIVFVVDVFNRIPDIG